ncbi:MAG TPA: metallophosphoesterase [Tepidisphaeraceae bacterium]
MISTVLQSARLNVRHRVWVISDLQQSIPAEARRCLSIAIDDFRSLDLPVEQIWYLGDAVEGSNLPHLEEMAAMQVEALSAFGAPLRYVLGNHDFDFLRHDRGAGGHTAIFRDAVARLPGWRTTDSIESFYFIDSIGDFTVLFLSDHADPRGRWASTHGTVHGDAACYPHDAAAYQAVRDRIAAADGPVITCAHYAFAGGNRPSNLFDEFFPLPPNVRLHLYGHAHIGDAVWVGKDRFRKIAGIDDHPIVQCDIASLEDARGSAVRSAMLEIYEDRSLGLFFRNHTTRRWEESLILDAQY